MRKQVSSGVAGTSLSLVIGAASGAAASAALLLVCAWLVASGKMPESAMPALTLAACFIGAAAGAFISFARVRKRALPVGIGAGAIMFALLWVMGIIFIGEPPVGAQVLSMLLAALGGGAIGGLLKLTKKKRRK